MILSLYEECIICLINKDMIFRKKDFITELFTSSILYYIIYIYIMYLISYF